MSTATLRLGDVSSTRSRYPAKPSHGRGSAPGCNRRKRWRPVAKGTTPEPQLPTTSVVTPWRTLNGISGIEQDGEVVMAVHVDEPGRDRLARGVQLGDPAPGHGAHLDDSITAYGDVRGGAGGAAPSYTIPPRITRS